jgi:hypothetical protein
MLYQEKSGSPAQQRKNGVTVLRADRSATRIFSPTPSRPIGNLRRQTRGDDRFSRKVVFFGAKIVS